VAEPLGRATVFAGNSETLCQDQGPDTKQSNYQGVLNRFPGVGARNNSHQGRVWPIVGETGKRGKKRKKKMKREPATSPSPDETTLEITRKTKLRPRGPELRRGRTKGTFRYAKKRGGVKGRKKHRTERSKAQEKKKKHRLTSIRNRNLLPNVPRGEKSPTNDGTGMGGGGLLGGGRRS